ncbi:hypothetical protein ACOME3_001726 [Neoechinorhynchus agilis]
MDDQDIGQSSELAQDEINISRYLSNRLKHVRSLRQYLSGHDRSCTANQLVPRHMRRKAASYNPRRLPKRVRTFAEKVLKLKTISRSVRRKQRRRRGRLFCRSIDLIMRSARHNWLSTHIWHAKRFRMEDRWGVRVPIKRFDKCYRKIVRSLASLACVHDLSYWKCIEVTGQTSDEVRQKVFVLEPSIKGFGSLSMDGRREKCVWMASKSQPALCIWPSKCTVWIFTHPAGNAFKDFKENNEMCRSVQDLCRFRVARLGDHHRPHRIYGPLAPKILQSILNINPPMTFDGEIMWAKVSELFGSNAIQNNVSREICQLMCPPKDLKVSRPNKTVSFASATVPLCLIYRSVFDPCCLNPYPRLGSHYDIIVGSRVAGRAFWHALVQSGCRALGQVELEHLSLEMGCLLYPKEYPLTPACNSFENEEEAKKRTEYLKRPPSKRTNFFKDLDSPP